MRPRIVAVLPRGEAIRNFAYSRALESIAAEADLSVFSVVPSGQIRQELAARYGCIHELKEIHDRWPVRIQREILDMAHGRWLWSEAARERWELRDLEANTPSAKAKRAFKKLACY